MFELHDDASYERVEESPGMFSAHKWSSKLGATADGARRRSSSVGALGIPLPFLGCHVQQSAADGNEQGVEWLLRQNQ